VSIKAADVDRIFRKLELKVRNGKDKHAWFMYEGKPVLHTMRSQGRGDLGNVAHFIRQQLRVNEKQFADLRDCPMSRDDYVQHLIVKRVIVPPDSEDTV
jgi:hypothetical protein